MKSIALVAGTALILFGITALSGFRLGFPSWVAPGKTELVRNATVANHGSATIGDTVRLDAQLTNSLLLSGGNGDVYLVAMLKASKMPQKSLGRPALNISLVIDKSGSMEAAGKIEQARQAAKKLVRRLSGTDRLSIVVYSTEARVLLPSCNPTNLDRIFRLIDSIEPAGATNLSQGIELGRREVAAHLDSRAINRVLLLSDGKANMGVTDRTRIDEIARKTASEGISITTLGLGKDFNEDTMLDLAESGRGNFYFIERSSQIVDIFDKELSGLMASVADNVELVIKPRGPVSIERVFGYRPIRTGALLRIPIGSLSSDEVRKVVIKLHVNSNHDGDIDLADLTLRFKNIARNIVETGSLTIGVGFTDKLTEVEKHRCRKAMARAEEAIAAENLNVAIENVKSNNDSDALTILRKQISRTKAQNNRYLRDNTLNIRVQQMEGILRTIENENLTHDKRSIVVKQARAQSYQMMR